MKAHDLKLSGAVIERGFWLYVWRITHKNDVVVSVGRTGDSSSNYAASPFNRLEQHLDLRPNAKSNSLLRNIRAKGFDPVVCEYNLLSVGPLYPEQNNLEEHRKLRDVIAPLAAALAHHLKMKGYEVIGTHIKPKEKDEALSNKVLSMIEDKFEVTK